MYRTATPMQDVTAGITAMAADTTTAMIGAIAVMTGVMTETTAAMIAATTAAIVVEASVRRAGEPTRQGEAASCARIDSMRARLTPRSLSPSREAERSWTTPAPASNQNSVSSTNRNHMLVNCA